MATFNGPSYITQQTQAILDCFSDIGGICEIRGEFLHDELFIKLLPGYASESQANILKQIIQQKSCNIIYCINAKHIVRDKQLSQKYLSFEKYIIKELGLISSFLSIKPQIVITMLDKDFIPPHIRELEELIHTTGYTTSHFYEGEKYSIDESKINFITSYGTDTGKTSLCRSLTNSKYALWSSLPIEKISDSHPINLIAKAYEYFSVPEDVQNLSVVYDFLSIDNNDNLQSTSKELISDRISFYEKLVTSGHGEEEAVERCEELLKYFKG